MIKVITIDMDDVLSETVDAFLKDYNYNIKGKAISRKDVTRHEFDEIGKYDLTFEERYEQNIRFLTQKNVNELLKPVLGAKEKLLEWKKKGYKLYVVTGRPEIIRTETINWLDYHYPNIFDDVYFTNMDDPNAIPKSEVCKKLGSDLMLEDSLFFSRELSQNGVKVYLFDKPWNQDFDPIMDKNIKKIKSWEDIDI